MIFLVHHGEAVGADVDAARPLSDRGRADVDMLAQNAAARGVKPDAIWHSGKLRARQTAEAFWRHCNPFSTFTAVRGLQPGDPPSWIADALSTETQSILLVGHFPHLPQLLARMLSGAETSPADFPINGMVALEKESGWWMEEWRLGRP